MGGLDQVGQLAKSSLESAPKATTLMATTARLPSVSKRTRGQTTGSDSPMVTYTARRCDSRKGEARNGRGEEEWTERTIG